MNHSSDLSSFKVVWVQNPNNGSQDQDPLSVFTLPHSISVPLTVSVAPVPTVQSTSSGITYSLAELRRMGRKQPKQQENPSGNTVTTDPSSPVQGSYASQNNVDNSVSQPDLKENDNGRLPFCITKVWSISTEAGAGIMPEQVNVDPLGIPAFEIPQIEFNLSSSPSPSKSARMSGFQLERLGMDWQATVDEFRLRKYSDTADQIAQLNGSVVPVFEDIPSATVTKDNNSDAASDSDALSAIIGESEDTEPPPKRCREQQEVAYLNDLEIMEVEIEDEEIKKTYPKPPYSYACLIALALKNSHTGCLPVSEIYRFLFDHFPYFKTAQTAWKDQIRSYLKTKYFEKSSQAEEGLRKGNFWTTNPAMIPKFEKEMQKWSLRNHARILASLSDPENLELLEQGKLVRDYSGIPPPVKKVVPYGMVAAASGRPRGRPKGSLTRKTAPCTVSKPAP